MKIELMPSQIFYSQDNIKFCLRDGRTLGEVLDLLIDGKESVQDLGLIRVTKRPGDNKWFTLDNRRLWLFHHLQGAGKCKKITVLKTEYDYGQSNKFTTRNGGVAVKIRKNYNVYQKYRPTPVTPCCSGKTNAEEENDMNFASNECVLTSKCTDITANDDVSFWSKKEGVLYKKNKKIGSAVSTTILKDAFSTPTDDINDIITKNKDSVLSPAVSTSTDDTNSNTKVIASVSNDKRTACLVNTPLEIDCNAVKIYTHAGQQDESDKVKQAETQNETTGDVPTALADDIFHQQSIKRRISSAGLDVLVKKQKN